MKIFIIKKENLLYILFLIMVLILFSASILKWGDTVVFNQHNGQKSREIHAVTD